MSGFDTSVTEVARGTFPEGQLRSLRTAFTAIRDEMAGVILIRGLRRTVTCVVGASLSLVVDCPFRPTSVVVFSVVQTGGTLSTPPIVWTWSANPRGGAVTITDPLGNISGSGSDPSTFDILLEQSNG